MKTILSSILSLSILAAMTSCGSEEGSAISEDFYLQIKIDSAEEGKLIILAEFDDLLPFPWIDSTYIDSAYVENGMASFSGSLEDVGVYQLVYTRDSDSTENGAKNGPMGTPLFLSNDSILVSLNYSELARSKGRPPLWDIIEVEGSEHHQAYMSWYEKDKALADSSFSILRNQYGPAMYPNVFKQPLPAGDPEEVAREAFKRIVAIEEQRYDWLKTLLKKEKDSPAALFAAKEAISRLDLDQLREVRALVSDSALSAGLGKEMATRMDEWAPVSAGNDFLDVTIETVEGDSIQLADLLNEGKYVLIDVWASWCKPCRMEIPNFKKAYEQYHDQGFEIVSVSVDHNLDSWRKAMDEEDMPWKQYLAPEAWESELVKTYQIMGIPTCLFISPEGKIITRDMRGMRMIDKLEELYGPAS